VAIGSLVERDSPDFKVVEIADIGRHPLMELNTESQQAISSLTQCTGASLYARQKPISFAKTTNCRNPEVLP
jgi:hypothetical protein